SGTGVELSGDRDALGDSRQRRENARLSRHAAAQGTLAVTAKGSSDGRSSPPERGKAESSRGSSEDPRRAKADLSRRSPGESPGAKPELRTIVEHDLRPVRPFWAPSKRALALLPLAVAILVGLPAFNFLRSR